ncbi:hypothetical protein MCETE7_01223 [Acidimicrobiia bacterium]
MVLGSFTPFRAPDVCGERNYIGFLVVPGANSLNRTANCIGRVVIRPETKFSGRAQASSTTSMRCGSIWMLGPIVEESTTRRK